jgi:KaiC/GvpD/RAD55 family RecA-like ATPase
MPLTINNINVSEILRDTYEDLGEGCITLLQVPIEKAMDVNVEAITVLQSLGYEGIYITLSKDYQELSKILTKKGVDMEKLMVVDGISQMYGMEEVENKNVQYVSGPIATDAISESITKMGKTMNSKKKFVFLDSITTVLLYNSLERTLQFSKFLTQVLKELKITEIVVSVSQGFANKELIKELTKISNKVINLQTGK